MKVLHIITGLGDGGAESMLFKLVTHSPNTENIIISLMDEGKYGQKLKEFNTKIKTLNMQRGSISFFTLLKLYKIIRKEKPDIIQTWMNHANVIGGLIGKLAGINNIFWNIRSEDINLNKIKFRNKVIFFLGTIFSYLIPKKIITCSKAAIKFHIRYGYKNIFYYIPNGFDTKKFFKIYDDLLILQQRKKWEKNLDYFICGIVARYHPQKNHYLILNSINNLKNNQCFEKLFFVFAGEDVDYNNNELLKKINDLDLNNKVLLTGKIDDTNTLFNSIDILILASGYGEGFPNVIGESMLCGTPCIVTDTGDSKDIISNFGWLAKKNDVSDLSKKIRDAFLFKKGNTEKWKNLSYNCSLHIKKNYQIETISKTYYNFWKQNIL